MRWLITYKNVRRDILQAMARLPACGINPSSNTDFVLGQGPREGDADVVSLRQDEQKIACMLDAVDLMLERCELTIQHTSPLLLCLLVSPKPGVKQPKPFALMAGKNTRKMYRSLWKPFIAFILRAYLMSAVMRERELKVHFFPELTIQSTCRNHLSGIPRFIITFSPIVLKVRIAFVRRLLRFIRSLFLIMWCGNRVR